MSISLPEVISAIGSVASINYPPPPPPPALVNPDPNNAKPVVICITRSVPAEILPMLAKYGVVESYDHDIHANVDPVTVPFQYLLVDLREKADRLYFQKFILGNLAYHVVLYRYSFERDMNISFEAVFSEFPPRQATRAAYDALLVSPPLTQPNSCLSFLGLLAPCAKA